METSSSRKLTLNFRVVRLHRVTDLIEDYSKAVKREKSRKENIHLYSFTLNYFSLRHLKDRRG